MWAAAVLLAAVLADADCQACHDDVKLGGRVHEPLGCQACHDDVTEAPHPPTPKRPECAACHGDAAAAVAKSIHAAPDGPRCAACHGTAHGMLRPSDPASPAAKARQPETCGSCHADPQFQARHKTSIVRPVEAYRSSVHGRRLLAGRQDAASCSDCHGTHGILPARDPASSVQRTAVPKTCGACHQAIERAFEESVHGLAVRRGVSGAPVCTDCHGEHQILAPSEPGSLVHPARVSTATCARCHGDERLAAKYNLPRDKVPAFEESYHGLALRSGAQHVANCASCHGVHNILPSADARSTIHPDNLARTCGACHAGAGTRFALGPVHVSPGNTSEHAVVRGIRWFYLAVIPLTLGLMLLHNAADFGRKLLRGVAAPHDGRELPRMGVHFRVAHGLTLVSFTLLVVTGFALKFPGAWWAQPLLAWEGEVAFRGLVHRIAGVVLLAALVYHAIHLVVSRRDRRAMRRIVPVPRDLGDAWQMVRFNLGLAKTPPRLGVFSYAEKAEYWAYLWGTFLMAVTGLLLWFDDFSLRHFPKWVSDAATAAHYYEAILATGAIVVWHFYMVIFDPDVYPMERAWITGHVAEGPLKRHRPGYYRALRLWLSRQR